MIGFEFIVFFDPVASIILFFVYYFHTSHNEFEREEKQLGGPLNRRQILNACKYVVVQHRGRQTLLYLHFQV